MPRKTKKDKVIAKLRRELIKKEVESRKWKVSSQEKGSTKSETKSPILTLTTKPTTHNQQPTTQVSYPLSLIKKDLTKTVALTILAISFEIGIYYLIA